MDEIVAYHDYYCLVGQINYYNLSEGRSQLIVSHTIKNYAHLTIKSKIHKTALFYV